MTRHCSELHAAGHRSLDEADSLNRVQKFVFWRQQEKTAGIQSRCFQLSYYIFSSLITFIIASAVCGGNEQSDGWWRFDDETSAQRLSRRCFFYSVFFFLLKICVSGSCVQPVRKAFTFSVFSHFSYFILFSLQKQFAGWCDRCGVTSAVPNDRHFFPSSMSPLPALIAVALTALMFVMLRVSSSCRLWWIYLIIWLSMIPPEVSISVVICFFVAFHAPRH